MSSQRTISSRLLLMVRKSNNMIRRDTCSWLPGLPTNFSRVTALYHCISSILFCVAHTLYTYNSWISSDRVVPSSLIKGVKAKPKSFFSPLSLAERNDNIMLHISISTHYTNNVCISQSVIHSVLILPQGTALLTHWSSVWTRSVGGILWSDLWG